MQIEGASKGAAGAAAFQPADAATESGAPEELGRALVAVAPAAEAIERTANHRGALFLAQLIATKNQHPQTRERRRAEPGVAVAAYQTTASLVA
jgi:hypothetical protein